jgi:putative thioredoxin
MSHVSPVTTADFPTTVLSPADDLPVLVDFWAPWCGPCRMLGPVLDDVAREFAGRLRIVKLNTDEEPQVAGQYGIRSIPAVKLFHRGKVVAEFVGAQPLGAVRQFLGKHLPRASAPSLEAARAAIARGAFAEASTLLATLQQAEPDNDDVAVSLADAQALGGDAAAARRTLAALSPASQSEPAVRASYARAHFSELRAAPDETDLIQSARVRAATALLRGDLERGLDELLAAMQRNRRFATGQGRDDLLRAFELAPADSALVAQARRKLAALLH